MGWCWICIRNKWRSRSDCYCSRWWYCWIKKYVR